LMGGPTLIRQSLRKQVKRYQAHPSPQAPKYKLETRKRYDINL
jgi:hypothetical protein